MKLTRLKEEPREIDGVRQPYGVFYRVGSLHKSKKYGWYKVISYKEARQITIEFLDTGFRQTTIAGNLDNDVVKDYLCPILEGVGCLGERYSEIKQNYNKDFIRIMRSRWKTMIDRCYRKKSISYRDYGAKGVTVDSRWLNFSNYFYDVMKLPGWNLDDFLNGKISLDKDKKQIDIPVCNRVYSRDTCCWLTRSEQLKYAVIDYDRIADLNRRDIIAIYPDGHIEECHGIAEFAKKFNTTPSAISACLNGHTESWKGIKLKFKQL